MSRLKKVLNNENGSPTTETLIAIFVGLMILVAMLIFGATLLKYIGQSTASVTTL